MLTVINARNQRGWSATDHLIDDTPLFALIGKTFKNLKELSNEAHRLSETFPIIQYELNDSLYEWDGSPSIPGRNVQAIKKIS